MRLELLAGITATTSAPTTVADGHSLNGDQPGLALGFGWRKADFGVIVVHGAGIGALTFQGIVFLYSPDTASWSPAGISATVADRGKLNDGNTLTGTTTIDHTEQISGLSAYTRIALQATTLTGTSMTMNAYLEPRDV